MLRCGLLLNKYSFIFFERTSMKHFRISYFLLTLFTMFIIALAFPAQGQIGPTHWITNGSYDTRDIEFTSVDHQGVICLTDTLTTATIAPIHYKNLYAISWYVVKQRAGDSAGVTIKRLDSWWSGRWSVTKTIAANDSTQTQIYTTDTIYNNPSGSKWIIYGNAKNDTVYVYLKLILKKASSSGYNGNIEHRLLKTEIQWQPGIAAGNYKTYMKNEGASLGACRALRSDSYCYYKFNLPNDCEVRDSFYLNDVTIRKSKHPSKALGFWAAKGVLCFYSGIG